VCSGWDFWRAARTISACTTASLDLRVPMWRVVVVLLDVIPASEDLRLRVGEDSPEAFVVGSRGEREEVEGSCSWVAILAVDK
jgi:hypothetical protein